MEVNRKREKMLLATASLADAGQRHLPTVSASPSGPNYGTKYYSTRYSRSFTFRRASARAIRHAEKIWAQQTRLLT